METSNPTADWRKWQLLCLVAVVACSALFMSAGVAQANQRLEADSATSKAKPSNPLGELEQGKVSSRSREERAIGPRARKPRTWKMPVGVAQRESNSFARYMYDNSTPTEFDSSGSIVGDSWWDTYGVAECSRMTVSMVNCIAGVTADFNVINDADQVVGEDTFFCIWEESYWYPRARTKRLKSRLVNALCGWESEL